MNHHMSRYKTQLRALDIKVQKHNEQKELVALGKLASTSLTEAEYIAILEQKQSLRDLYNIEEAKGL